MGLDQYIYKVTEQDFTRKKEFAYLRKANSLQSYFEGKYHIENLEYHKISKEDAEDILSRVTQVLNDISLAPKLLPFSLIPWLIIKFVFFIIPFF